MNSLSKQDKQLFDDVIKSVRAIDSSGLSDRVFFEQLYTQLIRLQSIDFNREPGNDLCKKLDELRQALKDIGCKTYAEYIQDATSRGVDVGSATTWGEGVRDGSIKFAANGINGLLGDTETQCFAADWMFAHGERWPCSAETWLENSQKYPDQTRTSLQQSWLKRIITYANEMLKDSDMAFGIRRIQNLLDQLKAANHIIDKDELNEQSTEQDEQEEGNDEHGDE